MTVNEFTINFMEFLKEYSFLKSNPDEIFKKELEYFKKNIPEEIIKKISDQTDAILIGFNSKFDEKLLKFLSSTEYKEYETFFDGIIEEKFDIENSKKGKVKEILKKIFIENLHKGSTGIVIAGFNEEDIYPSFTANNIMSIVKNELWNYEIFKDENCKYPLIQPFAQTDVVNTFLLGLDIEIVENISSFFEKTINNYPNRLLTVIEKNKKINEKQLNNLKKEIKLISENNSEILNNYTNLIKKLISKSTNPLFSSIESLPKEELTNMAESLIHITSLKRKVEDGLETVGGDIDVAVISKGDGFIWTKRKHYFNPKLNYQFFNK